VFVFLDGKETAFTAIDWSAITVSPCDLKSVKNAKNPEMKGMLR
jgi:hypothetical protein